MKGIAVNTNAAIRRKQGDESYKWQIQCNSDPVRTDALLLTGQQGLMIRLLDSWPDARNDSLPKRVRTCKPVAEPISEDCKPLCGECGLPLEFTGTKARQPSVWGADTGKGIWETPRSAAYPLDTLSHLSVSAPQPRKERSCPGSILNTRPCKMYAKVYSKTS